MEEPAPSRRAAEAPGAGVFGVTVRATADELILRHADFPELVRRSPPRRARSSRCCARVSLSLPPPLGLFLRAADKVRLLRCLAFPVLRLARRWRSSSMLQ